LQQYSHNPSYGNSQDAPQLKNGFKNGVFTLNGILFSYKEERNFVIHRCMDGIGEHHHVTLVSLRRPKIACSPSYMDQRPKTNTAILWDMGHPKGRPQTRGMEQGNNNLNVVDFLTVLE
jgi:hypothetical protein